MNKRKSAENRARLPSFNEEEEQTTVTMEQPAEPKVEETEEDEDGGEKKKQREESLKESEKKEEAKLKSKYPVLKAKGGSSFLAQKKLQRGHKFFDSGDYNLVKGKKPGLSGATSGASKTKPEKAKEMEIEAAVFTPEFATADAIISRRMALFRTKSESYADEELKFPGGRNMRSGSLFVSSSTPQMSPSGGIRRGSMFPIGQSTGSDIIPPAELLKNRRQSMIPAIPSKLAQ